jgi:hypothetical protein
MDQTDKVCCHDISRALYSTTASSNLLPLYCQALRCPRCEQGCRYLAHLAPGQVGTELLGLAIVHDNRRRSKDDLVLGWIMIALADTSLVK